MRDWYVIAIGVGFLFAIIPNIYAQESFPSPLKQIQAGVSPQDVKCKESFVLVIRESNEHPACIKAEKVTRFLAHGWITPNKFHSMNLYPPTKGHNGTVSPVGVIIARDLNQTNPKNSSGHCCVEADFNPLPHQTAELNRTYWKYPGSPAPVQGVVIQGANPSSNIIVPTYPIDWKTPLPPIQANPTITTTEPNPIKILSIGMSPNPLHVGYNPSFTVTYQNISNKTLYRWEGCGSALFYELSPETNVEKILQTRLGCGVRSTPIEPNQTVTDLATAASQYAFYYKITKSGTLNVNMTLALSTRAGILSHNSTDIDFSVNVTQ